MQTGRLLTAGGLTKTNVVSISVSCWYLMKKCSYCERQAIYSSRLPPVIVKAGSLHLSVFSEFSQLCICSSETSRQRRNPIVGNTVWITGLCNCANTVMLTRFFILVLFVTRWTDHNHTSEYDPMQPNIGEQKPAFKRIKAKIIKQRVFITNRLESLTFFFSTNVIPTVMNIINIIILLRPPTS